MREYRTRTHNFQAYLRYDRFQCQSSSQIRNKTFDSRSPRPFECVILNISASTRINQMTSVCNDFLNRLPHKGRKNNIQSDVINKAHRDAGDFNLGSPKKFFHLVEVN